MPAVNLAPTFGCGFQAFTTGGLPLNAGLLYTYIAGGTTPQATYTTSAGSVANANPIVLDADGRTPNEVWFLASGTYRIDVKDSAGNLIKTYDNLGGIISSPAPSLGAATCTTLNGLTVTTSTGTLTVADGDTLSYDTGSISSTFTFDGAGGTSAAVTIVWEKIGSFIRLYIPATTATSGIGSTALTSNTALPSSVRPTQAERALCAIIRDNSTVQTTPGMYRVNTDGTITIFRTASGTAYTNSIATTGADNSTAINYYKG